jgi:hypothetical protein
VRRSKGSRTVPSSSAENPAATPYVTTRSKSLSLLPGGRDAKSCQNRSYDESYARSARTTLANVAR